MENNLYKQTKQKDIKYGAMWNSPNSFQPGSLNLNFIYGLPE